jgi:phosphatidylglycerophosphate synthase
MNKDSSAFIVFFLSAMWHGFYPSYYFGFIFYNMVLMTERTFYKIKDSCPFYGVLKVIMGFVIICVSAGGMVFSHTIWDETKQVFMNVWWILMMIVGVFIFSKILYAIYPPKKQKKKMK